MYAIEAMIAGPAKSSAVLGPLRVPASASEAPWRVRAVNDPSAELLVTLDLLLDEPAEIMKPWLQLQ